jgi:hypothetical protein
MVCNKSITKGCNQCNLRTLKPPENHFAKDGVEKAYCLT